MSTPATVFDVCIWAFGPGLSESNAASHKATSSSGYVTAYQIYKKSVSSAQYRYRTAHKAVLIKTPYNLVYSTIRAESPSCYLLCVSPDRTSTQITHLLNLGCTGSCNVHTKLLQTTGRVGEDGKASSGGCCNEALFVYLRGVSSSYW